ncbi:MAG: ribokinase [Anaerolineae bacterium]
MPRIAVVGSINMDLVIRSPRLPKPGENIFGYDFHTVPGGKGANAAVALSRLGAESIMVGRVGMDVFGSQLISSLREAGVCTDYVVQDEEEATGVALIIVEDEGENGIVMVNGANKNCSPSDIDALGKLWASLDAVLVNFEIPLETVSYVIEQANARSVPIIVDAGPARPCPPEVWAGATILSPNEIEAKALSGQAIVDLDSARKVAEKLLRHGPRAVALKLGDKGALLAYKGGFRHFPGLEVPVVDTTAAGDAFTAALTLAYVQGKTLEEAVDYANHAGALAVTKLGAQPSMPKAEELAAFIATGRPPES